METVAPYKEIIDAIKESGGEAFKICYQCGKCDAVCPWNQVRTFIIRRIVRQATFGLTISKVKRCGDVPPAEDVPSGAPGT